MSIILNFKSKAFYFFLSLLGICCLLPFLLLSNYAYPQADDYYYAIRDGQFNFWSTQADFYLNWSGRFFSTAILQLNPLITKSFEDYKFYSLGIILAFAGSLTFLIYQVLRPHLSRAACFGLTSLLLALYLLQLPSTAESLFWLTGFLGYTLPNLLFFWVLFFLYKLVYTSQQKIKIAYATAAALTGGLIVGANEMALLYLMATLLFILISSWINQSANRNYFLAVFAFCLLVSLAVVLAPGNFSRMASHPQAKQPVWSVVYAGILSVVTFYRFGGLLLLASLVYVFAFGEKIKAALGQSGLFKVSLPLLLLYVVGTVYLMNFLFVWATGERPTPRLQNVIYFFLLLAWFYTLQVLIIRKGSWFMVSRWPVFLKAAVSVLLLLAFLDLNNNISTAYLDLISGKAAQYNNELSARDLTMATSSCVKCKTPPLSAVPASLHFLDLQVSENGEGSWVNNDYAKFWGKETVELVQPNPQVKDNYTTLTEMGKKWRDQLLH
ncbi:DUF6056 family protein [uncultured Pontibacter sp.]|uniref:DUF6056 family protein n=1 Tax=uncultured Pontibacter sp. TaxID=453356 RepID=UPI00260C1607|nr:DUF6056 family protein [uncultured Pontibacter sp.]